MVSLRYAPRMAGETEILARFYIKCKIYCFSKNLSIFSKQLIKHLVTKSRYRQPVELVDIISKMFTEGKIVFDARDPNKPPLSYFRDDDEFFPAEVFGWFKHSPLNPQVDQAALIYNGLHKKRHYVKCSKDVTDTLIECLNSLVYVNPALIDLVDNDLKFTEG